MLSTAILQQQCTSGKQANLNDTTNTQILSKETVMEAKPVNYVCKTMQESYRNNVLDHIHMRQRMNLGVARLIYFAAKHTMQLYSSNTCTVQSHMIQMPTTTT